MEYNIILLGGYGFFVWSAFIFTFLAFYFLYKKSFNDLKKYEKIYLNEYAQYIVIQNKSIVKDEKKSFSPSPVI